MNKIRFFLVFIFVFAALFAIAATTTYGACWDYDYDNVSCLADTSCQWYDPYCMQKDCYSLWNQNSCENVSDALDSCVWNTMASNGWCEDIRCWSFDGNQTGCEAASANYGLACSWNADDCTGGAGCWGLSAAECAQRPECTSGSCYEAGCWSYSSSSDCTAASNCIWNSNNNYCYEAGCWDSQHNTQATCIADNTCSWDSSGGYCYEKGCWDFNYNQSGCTASPLGCEWNDPWCNEPGCWNNKDVSTCNAASGVGYNCIWKQNTGGWCEKAGCWMWDNYSYPGVANATGCVNNSYGLDCTWEASGGWCYQDFSSTGCSDFTLEKDCFDTMYCNWNFESQECQDPEVGQTMMLGGGATMRPGCYIFDQDQTACDGSISGNCTYAGDMCQGVTQQVNDTGLSCAMINDSSLCSSIPNLDTCCIWQAGACQASYFTTACWDDLDDTGDGKGFCKDYNVINNEDNCIEIAGSPWFKPCKWNNVSQVCDVYLGVNTTVQSFDDLNNKDICENAGGQWVKELYCSGTTAKSTGWCEPKTGAGAMSCDAACWACEYKTDGGAWLTLDAAQNACENSKAGAPPGKNGTQKGVGWCQWTTDSNAPNGYGFCDEPKEAKQGGADCNVNCWACELIGDSSKKDAKAACKNSAANCKWVKDFMAPDDETKGACVSNSMQTCNDNCNLCPDQTSCLQIKTSVSCEWKNNVATGMSECKAKGDTGEICFNMVDDDNDGLIDCADNQCMTDPFCGGGSFTSCGTYSTSSDTCVADSNCEWVIDDFGGTWCDMKGGRCWENDGDQTACASDENCQWSESNMGSSCTMNYTMEQGCWNANNNASCAAVPGGICRWKSNEDDPWCQSNPSDPWCTSGEAGWCESIFNLCHQPDRQSSSAACTANLPGKSYGCAWSQDFYCLENPSDPFCQEGNNGWCDSPCYDKSLTVDQCNNDYGGMCMSSSGYCNPVSMMTGGGMGGSNCWQSDDNQTACEEQTACDWYLEPYPFCDIMKSGMGEGGVDCMGLSFNASLSFSSATDVIELKANCNNAQGCKWAQYSDEMGPGMCDNDVFECEWNETVNADQSSCEDPSRTRLNCTWITQMNECMPKMMGQMFNNNGGMGSQVDCEADGGLWRTGWCNPAGQSMMFQGMDMSPPIPLGSDTCEDSVIDSIDLMGFGIKEMDDTFAIGMGVCDFKNAATCNGISVGMGMMGPMGPGGPSMSGTGNGQEPVKFYVYLDTDGSTTGNCNVSHVNLSKSPGYEFLLTYTANWSQVGGSAVETNAAYKCTSGVWTPTTITVSSWGQKMCSMIGGGMVSVSKESLLQFPTLFDPSKDWRIYVTTADGNSSRTAPDDEGSVGYYTAGAMDFDFKDCTGFEATSDPDCTKFLKGGGKIKFESCFTTGIDEDLDGLVDCADPDCTCQEEDCSDVPECSGLGVNAADYVDKTLPKVVFLKAEAYPDSALITYDTDEKANGTLLFYHNDSSCTRLNSTVFDVGITNSDVAAYKNWHEGPLYQTATASLTYALSPNKAYYYKVRNCDKSGNCGQSKCLNFTTPVNSSLCSPCDFIFRLKLPDDWNISLDIDQDGTYEITQGYVCGKNAGTLVNYTDARSVNILLNNSAANTAIYLFNTRLTKGASNENARTMNKAGDFISGTTTNGLGQTVGYAGLNSDTRDMLINKLHPEYCYVKIPSDGTCDALYHCDDNMQNCVSELDSSDLIETGVDYCTWKIPNCRFSTWTSNNPAGASSGSGGGGGGGGSSGSLQISAMGLTKMFYKGIVTSFSIPTSSLSYLSRHRLKINEIYDDSIYISIWSEQIDLMLYVNQPKYFDFDDDGVYDLVLTLLSVSANKAFLRFDITDQLVSPVSAEPAEEIVVVRDESSDSNSLTGAVAAETKEDLSGLAPEEKLERLIEQGKKPMPIWISIFLVVVISIIIAGVIIFVVKDWNNLSNRRP